jgi:hypothetical protein
MGIKLFGSSDSRDGCSCNCKKETIFIEKRVNSTPDPVNFKIKKQEIINGYPVLLVNYPGVKNYEGNKILMYPKLFNLDLIKKRIDPHFFTKGDSPIARFEPTEYGWEIAVTLAKTL